MRILTFMTFDRQAIEALERLGFEIVGDDKAAAVLTGDVEISVLRPANPSGPEFQLTIRLPNGELLTCFAPRRELLGCQPPIPEQTPGVPDDWPF